MSALSNIESAKVAASPSKPANIQEMLKSPMFVDAMERSLPKHMTVDRIASIALTAVQKTPLLQKCEPISLFGAMLQISQMGLEIGPKGAYLLPFKNNRKNVYEVQVIPSYMGLVRLALRSDMVSKVEAQAIFKGDSFDFQFGDDEFMHHNWDLFLERGEFVGAWAMATMADGSTQKIIMGKPEIEQVRQRSKSKDNGPWVTDYPEMGKKTAVKRLLKMIDSSAESNTAAQIDDDNESGVSDTQSWYHGGEIIQGEATDVTKNPVTEKQETKPTRRPRRTKAQIDADNAAKQPQEGNVPPVVQGQPASSDGDAAGAQPAGNTQPAGGQESPVNSSEDKITYAKVAQGINTAPTEQDSQSWLNCARGELPAEQIAELVQLHLTKWKENQNG